MNQTASSNAQAIKRLAQLHGFAFCGISKADFLESEAPKLEKSIEGVMFYSPSTIQSFLQKNTPECIAYCIGESTAKEAKKYFKDVRVAKIPTVESVIELVNQNYI